MFEYATVGDLAFCVSLLLIFHMYGASAALWNGSLKSIWFCYGLSQEDWHAFAALGNCDERIWQSCPLSADSIKCNHLIAGPELACHPRLESIAAFRPVLLCVLFCSLPFVYYPVLTLPFFLFCWRPDVNQLLLGKVSKCLNFSFLELAIVAWSNKWFRMQISVLQDVYLYSKISSCFFLIRTLFLTQ